MLSFKSFNALMEGGNVKIGDVESTPVVVNKENRSQVQKDTHDFLHHVSNSFKEQHGSHLFGKNNKALTTGSAYSGSTKHLMNNKISHEEFVKHKRKLPDDSHAHVGDIDVKIPKEHMENLHNHLTPGKKFGKYTVVGVKRGGGEHHALIQHENGGTHQVDFEGAHYEKDEPSKFDQFSHSSDWKDTKLGIKGAHHKQLLNAIGTHTHKFSILHGLGSREDPKDPKWEKDTKKITHTLFGPKADEQHLHSFHGLAHSIKHHIPASEHQKIYDKFKTDVSKNKFDNTAAVQHLKSVLGTKD